MLEIFFTDYSQQMESWGGIIHNNNQFQFFTELIGLILIKLQRAFHNWS